MTSEQIQDLCLQTAKMGREAENGSQDALILMECQFLGEIALQLAIANEFQKHFRCIRCYRRIEHVDQKCDKAVAMACKGIA